MKSSPRKPKTKPSIHPEAHDDLKSLSMPEVLAKLESSADALTGAEAKKRLTQYGPNEIEEKKANPLLKFLTYLWGPIPWMIEAAVVLSALAQHWPDFFIILVLLLANAVVGFWEEHQADNAIEALKARLAIEARVRRDGTWVTAPARELVPGDVIRVRLGDIIPADARLLEGDSIEVDQSALTGEPCPSRASRVGMCSRGRSSGRARSAPSCMPPAPAATSARRRNSCRRRIPSAISSARCSRSATT